MQHSSPSHQLICKLHPNLVPLIMPGLIDLNTNLPSAVTMEDKTVLTEAKDGAVPLLQATRPVRWYRHWIFATLMLCCYGFFKEFKPSEPFLTPYLTSDVKNFTKDEVSWNGSRV